MKRAFCIAAAMTMVATGAGAGPHEGGFLVWHTADEVYTSDIDSYVGMSGISCEQNFGVCPDDQEDCSSETAALNPTSAAPNGGPARVHYVLAAFPPTSGPDDCPALAAVSFGVEYDDANVFITTSGSAGDFELTTANWPQPFEGTAITYDPAQKAELVEVYWFAAYSYYNADTFGLRGHPTQGAKFGDDSIPAVVDDIAGFGSLGLGGEAGSNPTFPTPVLESSWGEVKKTFSENE